jgi:hypothetical protein
VERTPPPKDKGATLAVVAAGGLPTTSTPFEGAPVQVMGFTVEQYASLTAELSVRPNQAPAVLARHGLPDEAARKKLADAWGRRMMREPVLLRRWTEACEAYRRWWMGQER